MATLVLTVIGDDRPGLVSALSAPINAQGGSWERGQLVRLAGKFAGVLLVTAPDERVAALEVELLRLGAQGLDVRVEHTAAVPPVADDVRRLQLHVIGNDRPGIVAEASRAIAGCGIGIEEIDTAVREAPHAGVALFELDAVLSAPADADIDALRAALEAIAADLMVDVDLR